MCFSYPPNHHIAQGGYCIFLNSTLNNLYKIYPHFPNTVAVVVVALVGRSSGRKQRGIITDYQKANKRGENGKLKNYNLCCLRAPCEFLCISLSFTVEIRFFWFKIKRYFENTQTCILLGISLKSKQYRKSMCFFISNKCTFRRWLDIQNVHIVFIRSHLVCTANRSVYQSRMEKR